MYSLGELRIGHAIILDGDPFVITSCQHSKQARGAGVLKTTLKNLRTGATVPRTFQGNDKLQPAEVGFFQAQYLYKSGDQYEFLHNETYEQFSIPESLLGDDAVFLQEGESFDVQHFNEEPIAIRFPVSLVFSVQSTVPGVKGDTAQGGTKPAHLENGITVSVPLFVNEGDMVQINTQTREFQRRLQK